MADELAKQTTHIHFLESKPQLKKYLQDLIANEMNFLRRKPSEQTQVTKFINVSQSSNKPLLDLRKSD